MHFVTTGYKMTTANSRAAIRVLLWQYAAENRHFEPTLDDIMEGK